LNGPNVDAFNFETVGKGSTSEQKVQAKQGT
jgi:hypothetical protein